MARKRKSSKKKNEEAFNTIIIGLILLLVGVLGFGFGSFGSLIKKGAMFLTGEWWILVLIFLIYIGGSLLLQRKVSSLISSRLLGFYLLILVVLIGSHFTFIKQYEPNLIINKTIENYQRRIETIGTSASIFTTGEESIQIGGGIIGGSLAFAFDSLFNKVGTIIVLVVLMIVGIILLFDIDFADLIDNIKDKMFTKSDDEDEEDNEEEPSTEKEHGNIEPIPVTVSSSIKEETESNREPLITSSVPYRIPSITLLDEVPKNSVSGNPNASKNIKELEKVLADFGIEGKVVEVHVGPAVTQFEVAVHSGTILSKVAARDKEIAAALSAKSVAIEAPIPGKSTVGIEIPNPAVSAVKIREVLGNVPKDQEKSNILVALGKDLMGRVQTTDITKMPHLLVAGSTGSGKSVCMNSIIASILMRYHYEEVKLVLVDPKKVEMSHYNGIPHLLWPVVTDPKKASVALQRIVAIMDERYETFAETGVKKIEEYNKYVEKHSSKDLQKMPYIVVIIDELADLMMVASKEVEGSIQRITQLARAAGIHLIVATQRPSTNVITGIIKANIPSRIAFAVASFVDSRTILDRGGAEKLLGKGDMLFMPIGVNNPIRIQGCFITDEEVDRVINFVRDQQTANYDNTLDKMPSNGASDGIGSGPGGTDDDPLYNEIVEFAYETGKVSASLLQRKFRLGYNRAARIIDLLEERGVIGPQNGSKPREVLGRGGDE